MLQIPEAVEGVEDNVEYVEKLFSVSLFTNLKRCSLVSLLCVTEELEKKKAEEKANLEKEKRKQKTVIDIKKKYGKNAIIKGMNLEEGATAKDRNRQIGGHKA